MSGKDGEERHLFCAARRRGAPTYSLLGELEGALVGADAEKLDNAALVGRKASDFADKVVHKLVALAGLALGGLAASLHGGGLVALGEADGNVAGRRLLGDVGRHDAGGETEVEGRVW